MPTRRVLLLLLLVSTALLGSHLSCKKPTEPINQFKPGKRDYVWTIDTLSHPQSLVTAMRSMYGTSSTDVFVVGHCEVAAGRMWHYDGASWVPVNLSHITGALEAIDGSGPSDIWVAGAELYLDPNSGRIFDSSLVARYDGANWNKVTIPKSTGLRCISVFSPTSVWAGSSTGTVLRFDGNGWTKYELGEAFFIVSIAAVSQTEAFVVANREDRAPPLDSAGFFVFRFSGTGWTAIDTAMRTPGSPPRHFGLQLSAWDGVLYSLSPNIYRYAGSGWQTVLVAEVARMWKSGPNNIFAVGRRVFHYNGIDWIEFAQLYPVFGHGCFTDGNEAFIVGNDHARTFVLHGR
jgi:hypothetical protein